MPVFDIAIISVSDILLFGASFLFLYLVTAWLLRYYPGSLATPPQHPQVRYAGTLLVSTLVLVSYAALRGTPLLIGLSGSALCVLLIGIIDERLRLTPATQLIWQLVIACVAVAWGWTIPHVSHPLGEGVVNLEWGTLGTLVFPASLAAVLWLVFLMNAINWLDGIDGLASSVGVVTLLTLAAISVLPATQDRLTLQLALLGAGAVAAFAIWNFPPAKVFLGTSGSWMLGLYIGLVAMVGGGKIVTTVLVLAIPVLDMFLVIFQRLWHGKKPWQGDTITHLHHHLQNRGFSARTITVGTTILSGGLGMLAIVLQTQHKVIALIVAASMLTVVVASLTMFPRKSVHT